MLQQIALFDVDGTLINAYSGFPATLELIKRKIFKLRRLPIALFYRALATIYWGDIRKMYEMAMIDMAGMKVKDLMEIGQEVFEKDIKSHLYQEGIDQIKKHQDLGHPVYLISSGPYMIIKVLEEYLNVNGSYSIGPVVENGLVQRKLIEPFTYKDGKIEAAEMICKMHQSSLMQCYFYADSIHDKYLLSAVGKPQVVNPDFSLKKIALKQKWPIHLYSKELGNK